LLRFLGSKVPWLDLEDVHHEVWLKVLAKLAERYQGEGTFRSWLLTIARNTAIDPNRKKPPMSTSEIESVFVVNRETPRASAHSG
jgi:DNA-directed RNA polymerase specialized sigma24 family protein